MAMSDAGARQLGLRGGVAASCALAGGVTMPANNPSA